MEIKTATQMASIYGLKSSIAFNKILEKCGLLVHTSKGYVLDEALRGQGYITVIDAAYFLPSGIRATKKKSVWTESGQHFVRQHLCRLGIVPISEQNDIFANKQTL